MEDKLERDEFRITLHSGKPIDIFVEEVPGIPGFVKKVTIYPDTLYTGYQLSIEFELAELYVSGSLDGPEIRFSTICQTLDEVISAAESLLKKPLSEWRNFNTAPLQPKHLVDSDPDSSLEYFRQLAKVGIRGLDSKFKLVVEPA